MLKVYVKLCSKVVLNPTSNTASISIGPYTLKLNVKLHNFCNLRGIE